MFVKMDSPSVSLFLYGLLVLQANEISYSGPAVTLLAGPTEMAEGPFWYEKEQALYFIDMWKHEVHQYLPSLKSSVKSRINDSAEPVTFIMPIREHGDSFIIGYGNKLAKITRNRNNYDFSSPEIIKIIDRHTNHRLNDAKISPSGVLFIGSMGNQLPNGSYPVNVGGLYKFTQRSVTQVASGMSIPNGMAWTIDEKTYYIADSGVANIVKYDYDPVTANISNKTELFNFKTENLEGFPDGLTIDNENHLWVATFWGQSIIRIHGVTGKVLQVVSIPAHQVTSAVFGGPNFDVLYVVTAAFQLNKTQRNIDQFKSGVYQVDGLGVIGTKSILFSYL